MVSLYGASGFAKHQGFLSPSFAQSRLRVAVTRGAFYPLSTRLSSNACSKPDGITGQVCRWLNEVELNDIPHDIQTKVKHLVLDGLACAIVRAKLPWSKIATQAVVEIECTGHCTLFAWNKVAVFGPPAAAAAVSKLFTLSPSETEDALGTACTQASGLMSAQYESMAKRMQHGFAARNGLFAALMSKAGYTGIDQVLERPYGGYLATFGQGSKFDPPYRVEQLVEGLREDWSGIEGIRIKSYGSVATTHAAIECIATLQAKYPEKFSDFEKIRSIRVEQAEPSWAHGGQDIERPVTVVGAQMSTKFVVAVQLLDRAVLIDQFKEMALERDDVWTLVDKTECVWNPEFDERGKWFTKVAVVYEDGETVVEEMPASKTIASLLPNNKIREKWRTLTGGIIDDERRDDLEGTVLNLDRLSDVTQITRLLAGEVRGALD